MNLNDTSQGFCLFIKQQRDINAKKSDFVAYGHGHRVMPAIWFRYEVSPITVKYTEKSKPLYHFLTTFCAIIGGTFTVAGMIDSMIFSAHQMVKKAQEGKLS